MSSPYWYMTVLTETRSQDSKRITRCRLTSHPSVIRRTVSKCGLFVIWDAIMHSLCRGTRAIRMKEGSFVPKNKPTGEIRDDYRLANISEDEVETLDEYRYYLPSARNLIGPSVTNHIIPSARSLRPCSVWWLELTDNDLPPHFQLSSS